MRMRRTTGHARTARLRSPIAMAMLGMLSAAAVSPALTAGPSSPRSDTGWIHTTKRECCNDALARAEQASAASCDDAGGAPAPLRAGTARRGSCTWESSVDEDGVTVFRCQGDARMECR